MWWVVGWEAVFWVGWPAGSDPSEKSRRVQAGGGGALYGPGPRAQIYVFALCSVFLTQSS